MEVLTRRAQKNVRRRGRKSNGKRDWLRYGQASPLNTHDSLAHLKSASKTAQTTTSTHEIRGNTWQQHRAKIICPVPFLRERQYHILPRMSLWFRANGCHLVGVVSEAKLYEHRHELLQVVEKLNRQINDTHKHLQARARGCCGGTPKSAEVSTTPAAVGGLVVLFDQ